MTFTIEVANRQNRLAIDVAQIQQAAVNVLESEGYQSAEISVAVVDDAAMHELNREYLDHDYPTDVLSFVLEERESSLEGEVIVSADTAIRQAEELGWAASAELLLYVIHGLLHLAGYDDHSDEDRAEMRRLERVHLERFGLIPPG